MIPRTILQTSADEPAVEVRRQLSRVLSTSWNYNHFTDEEVVKFFSHNPVADFPDVVARYQSLPTGAHRADLFRYFYLYLKGGVFVDSDAMLKRGIDFLCGEYEFFTVRSGAHRQALFQGFLGTTPGNQLIYDVLKDAYEQDPEELKKDYFALCKSLYKLVRRHAGRLKIGLLDEVLFDNGISEVVDRAGELVLVHYFMARQLPLVTGTSYKPLLESGAHEMIQPTLCLNMIVKNEMANLERCLSSISPHISSWVICDTGSTDGTREFITSFFAERGIPGELHEFPFENFSQARNAALQRAHASALEFDYLLLADADMELVVENGTFQHKLVGPAYNVLQRSGVTYWNIRLVRRDIHARYHGVTHEFLEIQEGVEALSDIWFVDHATGSNRVDKYERDIRLLINGLREEPENSRYQFYLAQTYRDAGRFPEAAQAYAKRVEMGGWDEERWYASWQQANCLLAVGDDAEFIRQSLRAFNERPRRAEPLWSLARYYRERIMNNAAALICEEALRVPYPDGDLLFIDESVYRYRIREEYYIVANYSPDAARKECGRKFCEQLCVGRDIPATNRDLARRNLAFYAPQVGELFPSARMTKIEFEAPIGYHLLNPSIANINGRLAMIQRTVNYLLENGTYTTQNGAPVTTRNFLIWLTESLTIKSSAEILLPTSAPTPVFDRIRGLEDCRLIPVGDELWFSAMTREHNVEGWCEQSIGRLSTPAEGNCWVTDWRIMQPPKPRQHEKNWTPVLDGKTIEFIYKYDPTTILDASCNILAESHPELAVDHLRGGSQAIPFHGGWLSICHEVAWVGRRYYLHRFAWFDKSLRLERLSDCFKLSASDVDYAAGLAWNSAGDSIIVSFGIDDRLAALLQIAGVEVERSLGLVSEQNRSCNLEADYSQVSEMLRS